MHELEVLRQPRRGVSTGGTHAGSGERSKAARVAPNSAKAAAALPRATHDTRRPRLDATRSQMGGSGRGIARARGNPEAVLRLRDERTLTAHPEVVSRRATSA
jgi:hypothetical protein